MEEKEIRSDSAVGEETAETEQKQKEAPDASDKKEKKTDKKTKAELEKAKSEIASLEAALAEEKEKYLRLAAEYDNFRRRSTKEKDGIYADAICDAVKEILPMFDNLARAGQFTEAEKVAEGLAMMAKMSDSMLEKMGVKRFGAPGDAFDPAWHNAVMHVDDETLGENVITDVFEVGYARGDKVIRFAMVKVAN